MIEFFVTIDLIDIIVLTGKEYCIIGDRASSNMRIITYWEGPQPLLIQVLLKLMEMHSLHSPRTSEELSFCCINRDEFLADKNGAYCDYFTNLSAASQADIVRVEYIYKNGGIWLDSDTLVMEPINTLTDILTIKSGFFVTSLGRKGTKICNGVFGSRASTKLFEEWQNLIDSYIVKKTQPTHGDFGFRCLGHLIAEQKSLFNDYIIFDGQRTMFPVAWFESKEIFLRDTPRPNPKIERDFQPIIILVNEVYKNYRQLPQKPGEGCTLDYYIQLSLLNLLEPEKTAKKTTRDAQDYIQFDKNILHKMARATFKFQQYKDSTLETNKDN
jgi:hypothetical protein